MRKKLSLFLAVVLCFLSFSNVWAAETEVLQETDTTETTESWDDLSLAAKTTFELGLIERDYNDNLNLAGAVTRADFAQIIYNIVNYKNGAEAYASEKQYFDDVGIYHYSAVEIECLTQYGIISGYGDNTFRPESEITVAEAAIMLLNTAGYQMFIEYYGEDVMALARNKGLLKDTSAYAAKTLTRKEAAVMVGNFLHLNTVTDTGINVSANGESVLYKYLGLEYVDGIIEASNGIGLYDDDVSETAFIINGIKYDLTDGDSYEEYVGYYARGFVNQENEVVAVIPVRNRVLVIKAEDIDEFKDNAYKYHVGNSKKTARVSKEKDILLNGAYSSDLTQLVPDCGYVMLIDNDNNGVYDVIKIESYVTYMLDTVISTDEMLVMKNTDSDGDRIIYDLTQWENYKILDTSGYETSLGGLKENMVVSIAVSGTKKITIYTSNSKIDGVISEADFSDNSITVDGTQYYVINNPYMDSWDGSVGQAVTIYFDKFGNAAGFIPVRTGEWRYAYIVRCYIDAEADALYLKLLDQDGEFSTLRCDDKLVIDTVTYKDHNRAYDVIKDAYSSFEEYKPGQEITTTNQEQMYERMSTRLVRYYLSKEGTLKKLDTPVFKSVYEKNTDKTNIADCLLISAKGRVHYSNTFSKMLRVPYTNISEVNGEIMTNSKTIIFAVPTKTDDLRDEDNLGVYTTFAAAGLTNDGYYGASGYVVSAGDLVCNVVVVSKPEGESSTAFDVGVVDKASVMLNEDDDVTHMLYGLFNNTYTSYEISDKNTYDVSSLKRGDVIFYTMNNGKVKIESLAFRMGNTNSGTLATSPKYVTISGGDHYFAKGRIILTRIQRIQNDTAILQYENSAYPKEFMSGLSTMYKCEPDMGREGFATISQAEIKTYETHGENADWVVIHQKDGFIQDKYLLRQ